MSVARHPNAIRKLSFCRTPLVECTNGISTLLQHSNLEVLHLDNCDFDAYACFEVVKSLNGNITLRELRIVGNNSMTLDRALFEYSNLRLEDERPPTASAILALVHVLRDNDTLLSLSLTSSGHAWALENFRSVVAPLQPCFADCRARSVYTRNLAISAAGQRAGPSGALALASCANIASRTFPCGRASWPVCPANRICCFRLVRNGTTELCEHHLQQCRRRVGLRPQHDHPGP